AVRSLPIGTAYAVWTGIGTVGTAVLGIVLFREPATVVRLVCIGLIVAGIIGLRLAGGGGAGGPGGAALGKGAVRRRGAWAWRVVRTPGAPPCAVAVARGAPLGAVTGQMGWLGSCWIGEIGQRRDAVGPIPGSGRADVPKPRTVELRRRTGRAVPKIGRAHV